MAFSNEYELRVVLHNLEEAIKAVSALSTHKKVEEFDTSHVYDIAGKVCLITAQVNNIMYDLDNPLPEK